MGKRKYLFYLTMFLVNVVAISLIVILFNSFYSIKLIKKRATSDFAKSLSSKEIVEVKDGFQLPERIKDRKVDYRKPHPYVGFKTMAATKWDSNSFTNGLGHRSPNLGKKEKGVFRIAMVGGSTAFSGEENDTTIIARVAKLIEQTGLKVEYINAAVVSSVSNQELSILVHDLLDMSVDLVISFDGFNDIWHVMFYNGRVGWPPFRWDEIAPTAKDDIKQLCPSYYPPVKAPLFDIKDEHLHRTFTNYVNNIKKMAVITDAFNIKYLAVLQPMAEFNDQLYNEEQFLMPTMGFYAMAVKEFERLEKGHFANGHYVSFAGFLQDRSELFSDSCHFNDEGNDLVAEGIFNFLKEKGILTKYGK